MSIPFRRAPTPEAGRPRDPAAFNQLVLAYQDAVYNCAYRLLGDEAAAADATQAAFAQALREQPAGADGPILVWLLRCLVRACAERLGAAQARRAVDPPPVQQCLAALPPEQRVVIALVDVAGLDYGQAAAVLQISHGQVRHRLAQARQTVLRGLASTAGSALGL